MSSVWIYVDTNKEIGDKDQLKVFESADAAETWSRAKRSGRRCLRVRGSGMNRIGRRTVTPTGKHIQHGCDIVASDGSYVC